MQPAMNHKQALNYFEIAMKLDPQNSIITYNIAKAYQMLEENDKALEYYTQATKINPNIYNAYYNMAIIYAQKGANKDAIDNFNTYLELNPQPNDKNQILSLISKLETITENE